MELGVWVVMEMTCPGLGIAYIGNGAHKTSPLRTPAPKPIANVC